MESIGIITAILTAGSFLAGFLLLLVNYYRKRPEASALSDRVRIRYLEESVRPWPGLEAFVGVLIRELSKLGIANASFWIEIVPEAAGIRPAPTSPTRLDVNGTLRFESYFWGAVQVPVLVIRQRLFASGPEAPNRSSLSHEFAEHLCPFLKDEGLNPNHKIAWATELRRRLEAM